MGKKTKMHKRKLETSLLVETNLKKIITHQISNNKEFQLTNYNRTYDIYWPIEVTSWLIYVPRKNVLSYCIFL